MVLCVTIVLYWEFTHRRGVKRPHFHTNMPFLYCTKKEKKRFKKGKSHNTPILFTQWSHQECIMHFNSVRLAHTVPINWVHGCLTGVSYAKPQAVTASCHNGIHSKKPFLQEMMWSYAAFHIPSFFTCCLYKVHTIHAVCMHTIGTHYFTSS